MPEIFGNAWRGLRGVARFSGRDTAAQFWAYAGIVIGLSMVAMVAVTAPMMMTTIARMQKFAAEHPDQATVTSGPGSYSISIEGNHPELMQDVGGFAVAISVISGIALLLVASAVTRRLHDRGRAGYGGLPAAIFLIVGLVMMPGLFANFAAGPGEPDMGLFALIFVNNILYLGSLAALLFQLVQSGTKGPNRYGDDPRG